MIEVFFKGKTLANQGDIQILTLMKDIKEILYFRSFKNMLNTVIKRFKPDLFLCLQIKTTQR